MYCTSIIFLLISVIQTTYENKKTFAILWSVSSFFKSDQLLTCIDLKYIRQINLTATSGLELQVGKLAWLIGTSNIEQAYALVMWLHYFVKWQVYIWNELSTFVFPTSFNLDIFLYPLEKVVHSGGNIISQTLEQ